ncbi:hypothetical protein TSUD_342180, partial [Trifolium subterraneum]
MAEKKRKERNNDTNRNRNTVKKKSKKDSGRKKNGPHLPSSLKKEIELLNPKPIDVDEIDSDVYEYEEELPEEESKKNKRYDPVAVNDDVNLSSDFEDENVQSDDENDDEIDTIFKGITDDNNKKVKVNNNAVVPELYPESEYNPSRDVVEGDGRVSIEDLLNPLSEEPEFAKLRKRNQLIEKHARTVHAPLPAADQAKVDRKVAYEITKKQVTKWQPIIKRNREAPTLFFDEKTNLGFSTIGAIASEFEPRTEFERKMAALVHNDKVIEAHNKDGSRLLELNKVSIEDEKDRQNRMAKMRSLLFRHEIKSKHVKKIKSRTFHRLLKKDRLKAESSQLEMDPEAANEYALKRERQRVEERMTLKHKHNSKWLQRNKQRGFDKQDEGTRAARRGLEKRKEATIDEVNQTLHEFEDSMKKLEDSGGSEDPKVASTSGRRVFGMAKAQIIDAGNKLKLDKFYDNSDSEDELEASKSGNNENGGSDLLQKDVINDSVLNQEVLDTRKESVFKNFDEIVKNPGPKTTYEVSIFASNTWKKAKHTNSIDTDIKKSPKFTGPVRHNVKNTENNQLGEHSDTDDEGQMVDGILTSASKSSYELPSQEELIGQTFAGDDVEGDFEKDKQAILNEENPEPERPSLIPGWGQWTNVQHKIGVPPQRVKEHENAQRKREDSLNMRKDAQLKNVIISEKPSKKAEKLYTKTVPFPYTSKEMFDQINRTPVGPDFNPTTTIGALIRPE